MHYELARPYPYLARVGRPSMRLPHGARLAFWVAPNLEFYALRPPPNPHRAAWPRVEADVREYSRRDFGNRVGIWRIIELLDSLGIRGTVALNSALCRHLPEIVTATVERGWEHFCHGTYNSTYLFGMSQQDEAALIHDAVEEIRQFTGTTPKGWLAPALTYTPHTFENVAKAGLSYVCDLMHDEQPLPVVVSSGQLISMPYGLDTNDASIYNTFRLTPEQHAEVIIDHFDQLYEEAAEGQPSFMCVPLHPFEVGHSHRMRHLRRALEHVVSHDKIWLATGGEIADWFLLNHYDEFVAHQFKGASA